MQASLFDFSTPVVREFHKELYTVKEVNYETMARIALEEHYAHRVPSYVIAFGLYYKDADDLLLAGVINYAPPALANTRRLCGDEHETEVLELNRLFCFEWTPRNSESYLVGQSFRLLELIYPKYKVIISYSDFDGQGHIGYIYQATNFYYTGLSPAMTNAGMEINGHEYHNISLNDIYGTSSRRKLQEMIPDAKPIAGTRKHRYIYFLGSKAQRKHYKSLLRWDILPYPKVGDHVQK